LQIHQFNKSFLSLFDRSTDGVFGLSFGQVSGCVNAVMENRACGKTSQCQFCTLKKTLLQTLLEDIPVDRKRLERIFYIDGEPVMKYLEFSSRVIRFHGREMVMGFIHDITEIETQKNELEKKQAQISYDLEAASDIQKSLLPQKTMEIENVISAWRFEPCLHVGGDLFQIEFNVDDHISTYALDVCGHGVSAAFVAMTISQFLSSLHNRMRLTGKIFSPEDVMDRLDKAFPMDRFNCFFSIAYATLNIHSGRLVYSNAGHMPPLILRSAGELEILKHHGTVIGAGFDSPFGQEEQMLARGDRFVLYTDGLVENFGPDGERNGKGRFYEMLKRQARQPLEEIVNRVFEHSKTLRGECLPTDDMSLVAIEYASDT